MTSLYLLASLLGILLGLLLLLFAAIYSAWAFGSLALCARSRRWPSVPGRIVRSEVRPNRSANGLPGHRYLVAYAYRVAGREYEGTCLNGCVLPYASRSRAERRIAPYPVGEGVDVFYSPEDAESSVLERGFTLECLYPIFTLALVTGLGLAAGWVGARPVWAWISGS